MSTRSIIAVGTPYNWHGVYVHSDGYPSGVGQDLYNLFHNYFKRDHVQMITELIENRVCGWSCTGTFPPSSFEEHEQKVHEWVTSRDDKTPYPDEATYYDGKRANTEFMTSLKETWCEWFYLLNFNKPTMTVYRIISVNDAQDDLEYFCQIDLATDPPDALYEEDEDEDEVG